MGLGLNEKSISVRRCFCRGRERIRTAVRGFADLCLATRPRDQYLECEFTDNLRFYKREPRVFMGISYGNRDWFRSSCQPALEVQN